MRILFAQTTPYLPDESGGALSNTDTMCRLLRARGIDVSVLAGDPRGPAGRLWPRSSASLPYPVIRARNAVAAVRDVCNSARPDIAVVQLGDINELIAAFFEASVPTLLYVHDQYTFDSLNDGLRSDPRLSYAACSSFIATHMQQRVGRKPFVFPVLIDPKLYRVNSSRTYATLINPIPRKGSEIVFALAACRPDIPFAFVEAWKLRNRVWTYLEGRAAHYGNIRLFRRTADMREIYSSTRLIVAPSLGSEAWGRVVSEGQVSGIPALVSDSGGMPEAIGPGGLVVERHAGIAEWLSALSRLWDDPVKYEQYASSARQHAELPDFQPAAIVEKVVGILKSVSGK